MNFIRNLCSFLILISLLNQPSTQIPTERLAQARLHHKYNPPTQKTKKPTTPFTPSLQESPKANCQYLFLRRRIGFFSYSVKNDMMLTFQNKLLTVLHYVSLRHKAQECHPAQQQPEKQLRDSLSLLLRSQAAVGVGCVQILAPSVTHFHGSGRTAAGGVMGLMLLGAEGRPQPLWPSVRNSPSCHSLSQVPSHLCVLASTLRSLYMSSWQRPFVPNAKST